MEIKRNKALFKYVVLPMTVWSCLFFIVAIISRNSLLPYLGAFWGIVGSLIFIVGPYKGNLLSKKQSGYIAGRFIFAIGLLFFVFATTIICLLSL